MLTIARALLLAALSFLAVRVPADTPAEDAQPDLGSHHYRVTTASEAAQRAFDRGLTLSHAFHHRAAEREFRRAAELDPKCAMAWWGVALVNGPHINYPAVPPENARAAWAALVKARALAAGAAQKERDLIEALATRYVEEQPADRRPLDDAYAAAMRNLWRRYPDDPEVGTLFAEAMMDLRPWDLWTPAGEMQPGTAEIVATLERVLAMAPNHPGANHFYIHTMEASPNPGKALAAADRLGGLVPAAGHLVHMPAHIYARVGDWPRAAQSNVDAIAADAQSRRLDPRPGFYALYMAHNRHFLAFAAMMQGRSEVALRAAREMVAAVPPEFAREYAGVLDGYMATVPEVLMRFGRWDDILREPEPPAGMPLARALWRFARATALTSLGRMGEARQERAHFRTAAAAVPADATFGNNASATLLAIAGKVLEGEAAASEARLDDAETLLREAVKLEDTLRYDEPPDWIQPVRHTLGAVLLRAGKHAEAERVYREDLERWPRNGWSLFGLGRALRLQGREQEAEAVEADFGRAWAQADVKLQSTCFCQPGV